MSINDDVLFRGPSLAQYSQQQLGSLKRHVQDTNKSADLDDLHSKLVKLYALSPIQLLRERAEFKIHDGGTLIVASLRVPVEGSLVLLHSWPSTDPSSRPRAKVHNGGAWLEEHKTSYVEFSKEFEPDTSSDALKAWGKHEVDFVEGILRAQTPELEAHNAEVQRLAKSEVEDRRKLLFNADALRDDLGTGI